MGLRLTRIDRHIGQAQKRRHQQAGDALDYLETLLFCAGTGFRHLGRFAILDPALIAQVAPLMSLLLGLRRIAMLVQLFLDKTSGLFGLSFNAHILLLM
jgi:hypothetical protein